MTRSLPIHHVCGIAIRLIDAVTGKAPYDSLQWQLVPHDDHAGSGASIPRKHGPLSKGDGYYAYANLPAGSYRLDIRSPYYNSIRLDVDVQVDTDTQPFIHQVLLTPSPNYPAADHLTVVRCRCMALSSIPAAGITLTLCPKPSGAAYPRLRSAADSGAEQLHIRRAGSISALPGEHFELYSSADQLPEADHDRIVIAHTMQQVQSKPTSAADKWEAATHTQQEGGEWWQLEKPLEHAFPAGTILLPISYAVSDLRGEALFIVRHLPADRCEYVLTVQAEEDWIIHLTLKEGEALRVELNMRERHSSIRKR